MGQALVITSGKGGVGKTETTYNLGISLALMGNKVLLIDADIFLPDLEKVSGMEDDALLLREIIKLNRYRFNLKYIIDHPQLLEYGIIKHKRFNNLSLIPSDIIATGCDKFPYILKELTECLKDKFDYILIDSPSGIDNSFWAAISAADRALIITTPDVISVRDADVVIGKLERLGITDNMLILNRVDVNRAKNRSIMSCSEILDILSIELLGAIPEDHYFSRHHLNSTPVVCHKNSTAGQAYVNIAKRLMGFGFDLTDINQRKTYLACISNNLVNLLSHHLLVGRNI